MIALHQHQIASGDQHGSAALDHDDDRPAGNVQFPDQLTVPRIIPAQDQFLQLNVLFVLQRLGAQNENVLILQNHISAGYQLLTAPPYHGHDDALWQTHILNGLPAPAVTLLKLDLDKAESSCAYSPIRLRRDTDPRNLRK